MMYKLLTSILSVIILLTIFPLNAFATASERGLYTHVKIGLVGNIAVTQEQIDNAHQQDGGFDFSELFAASSKMMNDMDITAGFLDVPVGDSGAPKELVTAMKDAGINFVSTASSHTLDAGEEGMCQTLDALDAAGVKHSGSYRDISQSTEPTIFVINGIKVGFFAYTTDTIKELSKESSSYVSVLGSHTQPDENVSSEEADAWSVLALPQRKYLKQVENEISQVRDQLDYIIAFVSCDGSDSEDYKSTWADIMIRAGVDFVAFDDGETVGSMEYKVLKKPELMYGRRTAYFESLGNATAAIEAENSDEGIMFVLTLGTIQGYTYVKAVQFVPLYIDRGRMLPIYDFLKYSNLTDDMRARMIQINERQTSMLMRVEDDKRLRSIYQIKPYVGNSQSADVVASYTGRLMIIACVSAVLLIILAFLGVRGKQLFDAINKSREK